MIATIFKAGQRDGGEGRNFFFWHFPLSATSLRLTPNRPTPPGGREKKTLLYLDLLGALVEVVLSFLGVLHQLGVPALLQLLLVLQVGHLFRLVLHLPAGTDAG